MNESKKISVSMKDSIILMLLIIVLISVCVRMKLSLVVPLFLCWLIIFFYSVVKKYSWKEIESYALQAVRDGFQSVMIVIAVGTLIGTWIQAGTVPTLIYYGLEMINPKIFLPATLLICSILSVATGTSYGSAGSAGLAMMGIGVSMGFPPGMIAAAAICGALFGDKMSPFSDTTNLCPAMAGGELFKHIGAMCWNTIPAWFITGGIFYWLGSKYTVTNFDPTVVQNYMNGLSANFNISAWTLIPALVIIVLLMYKAPALPTILIGAIVGGATAMLLQNTTFVSVINVMQKGFKIDSGVYLVDRLLNRGGINSMVEVVMIMIFGMGLGGMLEKMGILNNFLGLMVHKLTSVGNLVLATTCVTYVSGAIGCTMSMAQVIGGKLMAPIYREKGVAPEILSRCLEDAGTMGGTLMPWHTNAVFFTGALGVTYVEYIPYVFLCYLCPLISLIFAYTGFKIGYVDPKTGAPIPKELAPINQK